MLQVMKERDNSKPIASSVIQLDDAYWGGKKHHGRRGGDATGKLPFRRHCTGENWEKNHISLPHHMWRRMLLALCF